MAAMERERRDMVARQIVGRGITDARLIAAMEKVPREQFVADSWVEQAYADAPLPIARGQTISQPYIVARMIAAAKISPDDIVLEVGAGSGYAAAILGQIARKVYAIERHQTLADQARARIALLHYANVEIITADGTAGWPQAAPFDAILVAAAGATVPRPLLDQLAEGGRLVMPVGEMENQWLIRMTRRGDDFGREELEAVRFVPLIGAHGG